MRAGQFEAAFLDRAGDAFGIADAARGVRITISTLLPDQASRLAKDLRATLERRR